MGAFGLCVSTGKVVAPERSCCGLTGILCQRSVGLGFCPVVVQCLLGFLVFFLFCFQGGAYGSKDRLEIFIFAKRFYFLSAHGASIPDDKPGACFLCPLFYGFLLLVVEGADVIITCFLAVECRLQEDVLLLARLHFGVQSLFVFLRLVQCPFRFSQ
nr:MAG: hypothetical protein [Bacteriophage sp.]